MDKFEPTTVILRESEEVYEPIKDLFVFDEDSGQKIKVSLSDWQTWQKNNEIFPCAKRVISREVYRFTFTPTLLEIGREFSTLPEKNFMYTLLWTPLYLTQIPAENVLVPLAKDVLEILAQYSRFVSCRFSTLDITSYLLSLRNLMSACQEYPEATLDIEFYLNPVQN